MAKHDAKATRTRGIFRVSGSAKRVAELQLIFDTPPHYGSQLDWTGYTIHDASNVLRRYLNHLPDPVITLEYYEKFRDVHRNLTDDDEKVTAYQGLISKLPPPHSCLLMYLLDLLALFAHHSDENLMDSKNLASVFQPGVLSHPDHSMSPGEYMTSAAVLKFLIDYQSSFTMPKPNIDDDDEEMVNLGPHPPQHRLPIQGDPKLHGSSYVTASDHERIHNTALDRGVSFEADDAVHILNTGRRSNRASMVGSKIIAESESSPSRDEVELVQDLAEISEKSRLTEESSQSIIRRNSSIRKAATSPILGSEEAGPEFSLYLSRRKQLKSEGLHREPSVICQEIEIQFQAPVIEHSGQAPFKTTNSVHTASMSSQPTTLPRGNRNSQNISDSSSKEHPGRSLVSTTSHIHIPDLPVWQSESAYPSLQRGPLWPNPGHKRTSGIGISQFQIVDHDAAPPQSPTNIGMPITRAKSNPGDLTSTGLRNSSQGMSTSHHASGNHAIEKFKGLFTGKYKDHDTSISPKEGESKYAKKEKKRESLTDKQRKYMSQEVTPSHIQESSSTGWRGAPAHGTIEEFGGGTTERAYVRPPPPRPQQSGSIPPQRPPPPPLESSLMDLLDPPQRIGYLSGHSTPSEGSRSASPARSPSSTRNPLPANPSIASTSSVKSMSSGDRLYHGRRQQPHGSSSSLEFVISSPEDSHNHSRQHSARSGHSLQIDTQSHNQFHPDHHSQHQHQHQQHLSPHAPPRHIHHHAIYSPILGNDNGDSGALTDRYHNDLSPPQFAPRSRQSSLGSIETYDSNLPPTPTPKSRDRRATREGSLSSMRRGDTPPPRARSNSSRTSSPNHSPALKPLSRNASSQSIQGSNGPGHAYSQHQHHVSSPLAEGQSASYVSPPPSSRARSRAHSRDEQHFLSRQESGNLTGSTSKGTHRERERSRSGTGQAIASNATPPFEIPINSPTSRPIKSSRLTSSQIE
ncbi:hypothetical protein BGX26_007254 [Mortierella sp. AD094]|nr:hypothetical protein BGX26_007254 [Mortierella sp. AD094]